MKVGCRDDIRFFFVRLGFVVILVGSMLGLIKKGLQVSHLLGFVFRLPV